VLAVTAAVFSTQQLATMADSNLLVWIMRLQQTEALIEKRKEDLQGHEQRAVNLQADVRHEHNLSVSAWFGLLLLAVDVRCLGPAHTRLAACRKLPRADSVACIPCRTQQFRSWPPCMSSPRPSLVSGCSCSRTHQLLGRTWLQHRTLPGVQRA
jgi:hypothetical protein